MALTALAIDIMLPALPQIGEAISVESENHRQYVITAFLIGFGISQLFFGPFADAFGRRSHFLYWRKHLHPRSDCRGDDREL